MFIKSRSTLLIFVSVVALFPLSAGSAPVGFLENRGQWDDSIRYYAPGVKEAFVITSEAIVLISRHDRRTTWIRFESANPSPHIETRGRLPGRFNYFLGNDRNHWKANIRAYAEVVYRDVWPGVDLVVSRTPEGLSYEILPSSESDLSQVRFEYVSHEGDADPRLSRSGFETAWQQIPADGLRGSWRTSSSGMAPGSEQITTCGLLTWSTYLGGSDVGGVSRESGNSVVLDSEGNIVITGVSNASDFPVTSGAYDTGFNAGTDSTDAVVFKMDGTTGNLIWATFLGGNKDDFARTCEIKANGQIVVGGETSSANFPMAGTPHDSTLTIDGFDVDAFVAILSADGDSLLASTYLNVQGLSDLTLDASENPIVCGFAGGDFQITPGVVDSTASPSRNAFVTKFNPQLSDVIWSTFLSGDNDSPSGSENVAVNASGHIVVSGRNEDPTFPTTSGVHDTTFNGVSDLFVATLSSDATFLLWSTFLGGTDRDVGSINGMSLDAQGNVVVLGITKSADFPFTSGAHDTTFGGMNDMVITKLDTTGNIIWSTFLGGADSEPLGGSAIALADDGRVFVTAGWGTSTLPVSVVSCVPAAPSTNVLVASLSSTGSDLLEGLLFGGDDLDVSAGLALSQTEDIYLTGFTKSADFPTTLGAEGATLSGSADVFVTKMRLTSTLGIGDRPPILGRVLSIRAYPSPTRGGVNLLLSSPAPGKVDVAIYDIAGRVVRHLGEVIVKDGTAILRWDGHDGRGQRVTAGIYFVLAKSENGRATQKVVVMR